MIKVQLLSDVHGRWDKTKFHPDAHLIVAAGDLAEGYDAVDWLANAGKPSIYVPGNHEYYGQDVGTLPGRMQARAAGTSVTIADKLTVTAGATRFLCATLWTDHNSLNPRLMKLSLRSLNDYRNIKAVSWMADPANEMAYARALASFESATPEHRGMLPPRPDNMNPLVALILHRQAIAYLAEELAKPWSGQTIVVTHHAPTLASLQFAGYLASPDAEPFAGALNRKFRPNKIGAYASALDYFFANHPIDAWLHGHLHEGLRYSLDGADIITNPTGYDDSQNTRFRSSMLLNFPDPIRHAKALCLTIRQSLDAQRDLSALVKRCIVASDRDAHGFFPNTSAVASFVKIYNQAIDPLLRQRAKDCNRPDYILEPMSIQKILASQPEARHGLDASQRARFLHEFLTQAMPNEKRSKQWLAAVLGKPELGDWNLDDNF